MEAAQQKQFKFTDEIREKVLKFGECYYGALRPEEKGSYPEFLSALNKEHPEINLKSHITFLKYFPGLIEKWKRDFGKTFRSKALTKQFKQEAGETFIEVLSSLESATFRSIGYDDLFQLADERNPDLHLLKDHKPKTLKNNFHLDHLKKAASERRAPEAREPAPCVTTAAGDVVDTLVARLDEGPAPASKTANEGPCRAAARGSEPSAAGAASGASALDAGDDFAFTGEYDYRLAFGCMRLVEDASVPLLVAPPAPASVSNATVAATHNVAGAEGDGRPGEATAARASMGAGAAARTSDGTVAVARELATDEAAESRDVDEGEVRWGNMNSNASRTASPLPSAPAAGSPSAKSPAADPMDDDTTARSGENQFDSGDLTAFAK